MRQAVKELLCDAITYDEPYLAHAIYYAVQQGMVKLEDPATTIPYAQLDYEAISKMRDENQLMMCRVKLFIVPMASKRFALYLSGKEEEARTVHQRMFGVRPHTILDASDKMDMETYCEDTKRWQSFRDMKRQVLQFPYYAGVMCASGAR
ncbi:hypothetical protein [Sporosarcina sp. NPDC096371]|uniref:hypothetical protein n=1 Tax=Sporosarcina sp. NPDC096371 TaxID=3364530 RepID=UPI0037F6DA00